MSSEVAVPPLESARRSAAAWLNGDRIAQGGFVVVYGDQVSGWTLEIDRPDSWRPGCIAVPVEGKTCFLATGGDDAQGASKWEPFPA